ncbi:hypothetical protein ACN28C_22655 [Plantactinospora sp. WMMC1484]|uniref:hypothetical protein n=1 Tax=Plantactinospora sp. WMMC1484 TaxID=3404122 RepID=UPI003BF5E297
MSNASIGMLARTALAVVTSVAAVAAAAPPAAAAARTLGLQALQFSPATVDARGDIAVVPLTFTVHNGDDAAQDMYGTLLIQQAGPTRGSYVGQTYEVDFRFNETWYAKAHWLSGTPQMSTYQYDFVVPRHAASTSARWLVTRFEARDERGGSLVVGPAVLRNEYGGKLTAETLVDSTAPSLSWGYLEPINGARPYAYVGGHEALLRYDLSLTDTESGFWKGSLILAGPDGHTAVGRFEADFHRADPHCGSYTANDPHYPSCNVEVRIPADAASGTWRVTELALTDNAGNRGVVTDHGLESIEVTSNEVLSAGDFVATPNPVDNWRSTVEVQVGMTVTGARDDVREILLDFDDHGCLQTSTTPSLRSDGTVSVPVRVHTTTQRCTVTGIALRDGAGALALYGSRYGAPDPNLTITQLVNTTPPTASDVALTPTTVAGSAAADTTPVVTMTVAAPVAPLSSCSLYLYGADGRMVAQQGGGCRTGPDGRLTIYGYLPWGIAPGVYTYGFTLGDASRLSVTYGPEGEAMPGGPLTLTVTEG